MTSWGDSIILKRNEKVIASWEGSRILIEKPKNKEKSSDFEKNSTKIKKEEKEQRTRKWIKGYLALTNYRLIFINEKNRHTKEEKNEVYSLSLKRASEIWRERLPTQIGEPKKTETLMFELPKMKKEEYEKFKEQIQYYAKKSNSSYC